MAAQNSSLVRNEARIESLKLIRSRVCIQGTVDYYALYDIPNSVTLAVPASDEAVYNHGGDKAPLYIAHLEFGLRLPIHPFIKEVCSILGVSPSQLTPNAIGVLTGFLVICNRVEVEPSLRLFSNLVSVKAARSDSHYYFSCQGGLRLVSEASVSRKDWKEQFVWVIGADPILACPMWPEFKAEGLRPSVLSLEENRHLQKIREYAGSKEMHNLFDPASLRVARIARSMPSEADKVRAALLALPLSSRLGQGRTVITSTDTSTALRPSKRVRGFISSRELEGLRRRASEVVGAFAGLAAESTSEGEKRRKLEEEQGPSRAYESSGGSMLADSPHEETIILDGTPSPRRIEVAEHSGPTSPRDPSAEVATQAASPEPRSRPGKQIAEMSGDGGVETSHAQSGEGASESATPSPRGDDWIPFPHRISDVPSQWWDEFRVKMMGETGGYGPYRETVPESNRFVAGRPLDKSYSVLGSSIAQVRAVEQFLLPQDEKFLKEAPTMGLHLALTSYCVRGALIEQELFSRLAFAHQLPADFQKALDDEKIARVTAEQKVAAQQSELNVIEGKWRREVEIRDSQVRGLRQHREKQTAKINELEDKVGRLERDLGRQENRVKYLEEEVSLEKRHREVAQEEARDARIALDNAKIDLQEERSLREAAQATTQSLETRLAEFDSQVYKAKVIEEYRESPLGKFEVALACKAGFDYLAARRPAGSHPIVDSDYPPRVLACLDIIREVETTGGGVSLEIDIGEDTVVGDQEEVLPVASLSSHQVPAIEAGGQPQGCASDPTPES